MIRPKLQPEERIILALDFPEHEIAINWVEKLRSKIKTFKVGPILFLNSGSEGLKRVLKFRCKHLFRPKIPRYSINCRENSPSSSAFWSKYVHNPHIRRLRYDEKRLRCRKRRG